MSEVHEAAERLRYFYATHFHPDGDDWCEHDDVRILSAAYLAEHKPDDGNELTKEWLLSVGGIMFGDLQPMFTGIRFEQPDGFGLLLNAEGRWLLRNGYLPNQPKTRGDVRRLCKCLGVELKEPEA